MVLITDNLILDTKYLPCPTDQSLGYCLIYNKWTFIMTKQNKPKKIKQIDYNYHLTTVLCFISIQSLIYNLFSHTV